VLRAATADAHQEKIGEGSRIARCPDAKEPVMSATSTRLLRVACESTNNEAWLRLVSHCVGLLHGWLRRQGVQHADAEDLVQEALATLALDAPPFLPNGHPGAFRCWLRKVLINRLRKFRRAQRVRAICRPDSELLARLAGAIADPGSDLDRRWDDAHDRHVAQQALERIEREFQPRTWQAFRRVALEGTDPGLVAAELHLSLASVYAAKSRVLRRLRQKAAAFPD
jgi:RNA polymerase sigma-70 factor (ECF subfamily)